MYHKTTLLVHNLTKIHFQYQFITKLHFCALSVSQNYTFLEPKSVVLRYNMTTNVQLCDMV
uniref:Uncharacterized protein n=1 Tax=Arundo donax TaxID=35708 RepID=A0A0A9GQL9_ARUDO